MRPPGSACRCVRGRGYSRTFGYRTDQLHIRVISLENIVLSLLSKASDAQLKQVAAMADLITPRPDATQHPLTIHAATQMNSARGIFGLKPRFFGFVCRPGLPIRAGRGHPRLYSRKRRYMDLDTLLSRYFGNTDVSSVSTDVLVSGIERCQADLGLEQDRGKRFALWAMLHMLGSAPALHVVFEDPGDQDAARTFMDLLAASEDAASGD